MGLKEQRPVRGLLGQQGSEGLNQRNRDQQHYHADIDDVLVVLTLAVVDCKGTVNICYYFARSLDTIALLMQEQFKAVGIKAELTGVEDADSTYRVTGEYDIALYCMIADQAGDPYYCINALFRQSSDWSVHGGFKNDQCEKLIDQLASETDTAKRAELANKIVQMVIDDNAYGFVGLFNKTTVAAPGVVNIGENSPFDYYAVSPVTDKQ